MKPLVSICIPTYEQNGVGVKHLKELLKSIASPLPVEIIISDNSRDQVIQNMILDDFTQEIGFGILRYFRNEKRGAAVNTNNAIDQASSEIIKIMYMDDLFTGPDSLDHFIQALQDPGKHWCISDSIWIDAEGNKIRDVKAKYDEKRMKRINTIGMPSVIAFKKTDLRFDPDFKTSFDSEFYVQLYNKYGPPAHIEKPVIAQRIHENSLSSNQKDFRTKDLPKILMKHGDLNKSFFHRNRAGRSGAATGTGSELATLPATGLVKSYTKLCKIPSDINEHLPLLKEIAMQCEHVTEMGVRNVVSTYAFLEGTPKTLVCYDIKSSTQITPALKLAKEMGVKLLYKIRNVLEIEIEPTDFLFIDTLHTYKQLTRELELHSGKVRKFIGFHDVTYFGLKDESKTEEAKQGLLPAIIEFLQDHPEWKVYRYIWGGNPKWNNGCLILKKDERPTIFNMGEGSFNTEER